MTRIDTWAVFGKGQSGLTTKSPSGLGGGWIVTKKALLGSTAIVGASLLMAGPSYADWPKDPKVWVSGATELQIGGSDQDQEGFSGASGDVETDDRGYGFITDTEIRVRAKGTTDAGMRWSFKVELEIDEGSTANTDELQVTFAGSWGAVTFGNEDGAEDLLYVSSENADFDAGTGGTEGDWERWVNADSVTGRFAQDPTLKVDSSDATKISYFTPRVNGVMLGVSYVPDEGAKGQAPDTDDNKDGEFSWGFGANYKQKFGDFSVQIGAVGSIADTENLTGQPDAEDTRAWEVGAVLGWGPFKVGGSFQDNSDSKQPTTGTNDDSTGFDVGIGYEQGPILLGLNWMHSEVGAGADFDADEQEVVTLGATYKLSKNVLVYAEGVYYSSDAADPSAIFDPNTGETFGDRENDAWLAIVGAGVKF